MRTVDNPLRGGGGATLRGGGGATPRGGGGATLTILGTILGTLIITALPSLQGTRDLTGGR